MRILLLSDDMQIGGVPRHIGDLAAGLIEQGHFVMIGATDGPYRARIPQGASFLPLPILLADSLKKDFLGFFPTLRILKAAVRDRKIDIIHSHKRYSDFLASVVARWTNIPHVSTCHNTFNNYRKLTRFGHQTIACCNHVRNVLIRDFRQRPESVHTIYNGIVPLSTISKDRLSQMRMSLGLSGRSRLIASIGSLSYAKDRMTLMKALNLIKSALRKDNALCVIVGEGSERSRILEYIRTNELSDIIRILPAETDIAVIANIAEFFVLSSIQEGLPYVLLEAASVGKPHISTNVGGIPEFIIDGETGLLVPPRSPGELGAAIETLLNAPQRMKKLGRNAKKKFEQQHEFEHFIAQTIQVYEKALSGKNVPIRNS